MGIHKTYTVSSVNLTEHKNTLQAVSQEYIVYNLSKEAFIFIL